MLTRLLRISTTTLALIALSTSLAVGATDDVLVGEQLNPATYGPVLIESIDEVIARSYVMLPSDPKGRNGAQGTWVVPSIRASGAAHSGLHYVMNKWGDTRMGIGFPELVGVRGAWMLGQSGPGATTSAVRAIGYRDGAEVAATDWFSGLGEQPVWFEMDLSGVDRIEVLARPKLEGGGWYGLDDLTFSAHAPDADAVGEVTVLDFEDLAYGDKVTGSGYGGLTWETGTGDFDIGIPMPPPRQPEWFDPGDGSDYVPGDGQSGKRSVPAPMLERDFRGAIGNTSFPPDTMGAVGPNYFIVAVNQRVQFYRKSDQAQIVDVDLGAFFPFADPGSGDPRILFDHHSQRWILIASEFLRGERRILFAMSRTSNPLWPWIKTAFKPGEGVDVDRWPDYPTLGVDGNGIYIGTYMIGGERAMTIFAIDKAPLISPGLLGTITAFRELPWEGAIQPAHTYGTPGVQYFVSKDYSSPHSIVIRQVNPPLTAPTLSAVATIPLPNPANPPDAPALGSSNPIDTLNDARFMMSLYRDGYIWAAHTVGYDGRAACGWYQIDPLAGTIVQSGTVTEPGMHYYFPSIMVNAEEDVVLGFSGSNENQYVGGYFTGRRAEDPPGEMSAPMLLKSGDAPYQLVDSAARNRWGDYSYTTLDPTDELTFWTIQEYVFQEDRWGTWIGQIAYLDSVVRLGDLNCDGEVSFADINPYVLAATDQPGYDTAYTDCNWNNADFNEDGVIDQVDVHAFVDLLLN